MSLYGSLYSGVSGLKGQSNKIGILSDNISNANTIGYKSGTGIFETLVTNSGTVAYSPGGVLGENRQEVSKQGLLQTTDSATDIAISGRGFFIVNTDSDSAGSVLYTRAGSFRQDSLGNFRNSAGYYLQGWPLDREGRLPGEAGNANTTSSTSLSSLETVNVSALTGVAAATTNVAVSANLKSSETAYPGQAGTVDMDSNTTFNFGISAKDIIAPGGANSLARGDKMIITTGSGLSYSYRYGGFTYGRDVTTANNGDSGLSLITSPVSLGTNPFTTTSGSKTVTITSTAHGLQNGQVITLSGVAAAVDGIPSAEFNQSFVISNVTANTFQITMPTTAASAGLTGGGAGISMVTRPFVGNIFDASTATQAFLGTTGTTGFTSDALTFTINTATVGTKTFTYTSSTPNAQLGQFNNLNNLADAINSFEGLTARVVNNRIYIGAVDANEAITFANGSTVGVSGPPVKSGIDWIHELGIASLGVGDDRFSSMEGLAELVNNSPGLNAEISNPQSVSSLTINVEDPLDTITFSDAPVQAALAAFTSSTPFTTSSGSTTVSLSHPSPHGLKTGDIVTLDDTTMTGYLAAVSATNAFATNTATNGGGNTTITVTRNAHGYSNGQVVHIDPSTMTGYPSATINGVPLSALDGNFTVSGVTANTFNITVVGTATGTGSGGAGTYQTVPTFNGIPMTDFNGAFEITVTGPSTYNITVADAATSSGPTGAAGLTVTPPNNSGSVVAELGLVDSLDSASYTPQTTGVLGPAYDPLDTDKNMASGSIVPQYFTNVRVYDSLGTGHELRVGFIKVADNTWASEVYAVPSSDVSSNFANGQLSYGTISFNGDGSLRTVSSLLSTSIAITWANGASDSAVTMNWGTAGLPFGTTTSGTIGKTDGMSQFDTSYKVNFVTQNGVPVGELIGVSITDEGFVVANYNNGETQNLYKIPIADFANPDQLQSISGNVFARTSNSGEVNLREPGTGGTGKIQASTLESSNVELAEQLTDMIVAQRAYQANTKVITTADSLLEELNRILT